MTFIARSVVVVAGFISTSHSFNIPFQADMLLRIYPHRPLHLLRSSLYRHRTLTISTHLHQSNPSNTASPPPPSPSSDFNRPSPPRLPKHLQEEFENLQRQAETAPTGKTADDGSEVHPDMRRPVRPEFTGERNPVTGEVGGPKVEPTKHGDWSYGGRASDF